MVKPLRLVAIALVLVPGAAHAGKPDLDKLGEKCGSGNAKACGELADIALQPGDVTARQSAIEKIADQHLLAIIASKHELEAPLRLAAIDRLKDQAALADIVTSAAPAAVRGRALSRVTDEKRLAQIAKGSSDRSGRVAAVQGITDAALLEDIAQTTDVETSVAAIGRLGDPVALARLARGEEVNDALAKAIAERITDPAVITDLALNTRGSMRSAARERCTDGAALGQLIKKDLLYNEKTTGRDIARIADQAVLADIAVNARPWETRRDAVQGLRDTAALAKIAKADENEDVRALAVRRAAAVRRGIAATGILLEPTVGQPLGQFAVEIGKYGTIPVSTTRTDALGHFALEALEPGKWNLMHQGSTLRGPKDEVSVQVPLRGRADLGTLAVQNDDLVTRELGALCDGEGMPARVPAGDLVVFTKEPRGWQHRYQRLRELGWTPPWKAAVCIKEGAELVGSYVDKDGNKAGNAYTSIWRVRVIRLTDGKVFANNFTAEPPKTTTAYKSGVTGDLFAHGSGNPQPALVAWLKDVR